MVTTVDEYRATVRKEVTAPSGHAFIVRKLKQEDFVPKGLVALTLETMTKVPREAAIQYLKEHPQDVLDIEAIVLLKGVVEPKLSMTERPGFLMVDELEELDRKFLFDTISDFSGLTERAMAAVDNFRSEELDSAGSDGQVLREDAVGVTQPGG